MYPSEKYQQELAEGKIMLNQAQIEAMQTFDNLYAILKAPSSKRWIFSKKPEFYGIYLYGKVGRGKTYLMDLFYATLDEPKMRLHFYAFMARVHTELKALQGEVDPLVKVVKKFAIQTRVICLDEFFVEDIADAMILSNLLEALFAEGIILVTTSNVAPENLYPQGLQREQFLPAIALIQKNLRILSLDHPTDYRFTHDFKSRNYYFPLKGGNEFLQFHFAELAGQSQKRDPNFMINDRTWQAVCRTNQVLWTDFAAICVEPRSSLDYLALAERYAFILIQDLPILQDENADAARRFIALVDTCYDRHVPLILTASVSLAELYQGRRLAFEFMRTQSRLTEMAGWIE